MNFQLTTHQITKYQKWYETLKPKFMQAQVLDNENMHNGVFEVNYGAIGGGITFMFTPTGLGDVIRVQENITGEILDLTDYANW
jgi:acyl CoA:acetate/3-ketoacid CoA transferase alpha subunit